MTTTISINKELHKKLYYMKIEKENKSLSETIEKLYDNYYNPSGETQEKKDSTQFPASMLLNSPPVETPEGTLTEQKENGGQ